MATRPNVIVIMADDLAKTEFKRLYLPRTFATIVDRGIFFRNFQVNTPLCGPSRSSMHTGRYAHNHGYKICTDNPNDTVWNAYYRGGNLDREFGRRLNSAGYFSAMVGRYNGGYGSAPTMTELALPTDYWPPGWDFWFATVGVAYTNAPVVDHGRRYRIPGYVTDALATKALAAIDGAIAAGKPFVLNLWPPNPHEWSGATWAERHANRFGGQIVPREPDYDASREGRHPQLQAIMPLTAAQRAVLDRRFRERLRSMASFDEMVGAVMDKLAATGAIANTYVMITSDNGYRNGHYGLTAKMGPDHRSTNVPFAIAGPGIAPGQVRQETISVVDVAPTIYELAEVPVPDDVDGRSFKGLLLGSGTWSRPAYVAHWSSQVPSFNPTVTVRYEYRALVGPRWRYIRWWDGFEEYYENDPYELTNVAPTLPSSRLLLLRQQVDRRATCAGATC